RARKRRCDPHIVLLFWLLFVTINLDGGSNRDEKFSSTDGFASARACGDGVFSRCVQLGAGAAGDQAGQPANQANARLSCSRPDRQDRPRDTGIGGGKLRPPAPRPPPCPPQKPP